MLKRSIWEDLRITTTDLSSWISNGKPDGHGLDCEAYSNMQLDEFKIYLRVKFVCPIHLKSLIIVKFAYFTHTFEIF